MSRRARRERPATPAEQRQVERFIASAADALNAPSLDARRAAAGRMRRAVDRLRDPDNLTNLTAAELHDALSDRSGEHHHPEGASGARDNPRRHQPCP